MNDTPANCFLCCEDASKEPIPVACYHCELGLVICVDCLEADKVKIPCPKCGQEMEIR